MSIRSIIELQANPNLIITPRYIQWLALHGDEEYPPHVVAKIAEFLGSKPRDRSGSFSASSAGTCLRAQEIQYLGLPVSDIGKEVSSELMAIFKDGKWRHLKWQADLLTSTIIGEAEFVARWGAKHSRGTLDGLGVVPADHPNSEWRGKEFGLELKGINAFQWSRKVALAMPDEPHLNQIHRYFLLTGLDLFVVIYENKSTQAFHEWVITPDPERMRRTREELHELNSAVRLQRLHPILPACKMNMGKQFNDCSFGGADGTCVTATWSR